MITLILAKKSFETIPHPFLMEILSKLRTLPIFNKKDCLSLIVNMSGKSGICIEGGLKE